MVLMKVKLPIEICVNFPEEKNFLDQDLDLKPNSSVIHKF